MRAQQFTILCIPLQDMLRALMFIQKGASMLRFSLCFAVLACVFTNSSAQGISPGIDHMVEEKLALLGGSALIVGVIDGDAQTIKSYGFLDKQKALAPDERTVFEIGSITKTFTAALLADAVARGELKLDDPLAKYLPDYQIPQYQGQPITLRNLSTQTSGLPPMPWNFMPQKAHELSGGYTEDRLKSFMATYVLTRAPDQQYEYSNLGIGLLGQALAHHAGKSYDDLLVERVTGPLGMTSTHIRSTDDMSAHLAPPHDSQGKPVEPWEIPALVGAGSLKSNMHDMLLYLRANMHANKLERPAGLATTHIPLRDTDQPEEKIGLVWHVSTIRGKSIVWHGGLTGGYAAYIGFTADAKRGVVILTNINASPAQIGQAALFPELLANREGTTPTISMSNEALAEYVGNYQFDAKRTLSIFLGQQGLFAQLSGQSPVRIYPTKIDGFEYKVVDAKIEFVRDANNKIVSANFQQGQYHAATPRLPDPVEVTLEPATLANYVGTYEFESGRNFVVSLREGKLYGVTSTSLPLAMAASARDEFFTKGSLTRFSFKRDAAGKVTEMVVHKDGKDYTASRKLD